jgi:hypothetical protein
MMQSERPTDRKKRRVFPIGQQYPRPFDPTRRLRSRLRYRSQLRRIRISERQFNRPPPRCHDTFYSVHLGTRDLYRSRKTQRNLVGKRRLGIVLSERTDEDAATIFRGACKLGLEGIISKRLSAPYRSGPSRDWIKVKNPDSPAMIRFGKWRGEAFE